MVYFRRAHRKSRKGCIECKRRHIKCDESRPICGNCNISNRHCSYETLVSKAYIFQRSDSSSRKAPVTNDDNIRDDSASNSFAGGADISPPVNMFHLELFHHFVSDLLTSFGFDGLSFGTSAIGMTGCILAAPYLMNQILALSALHLSIIRPTKQAFYKHHAAQLQTHALSVFNSTGVELNTDTCLPMFLFSSFLAMHILCDKLVFRPDSFEDFLDHFIQSLRLHSGVRAITSQSWHLLFCSPLKPVLEASGKALEQGAPGHECDDLLSLVDATSTDPSIRDTYQQTIEYLQKAINGSRIPSLTLSAIGPIISWPVTIPPKYIDLLSERRPEALIILAHFGALLHIHHEMWTFADSGRYIILSVNSYVGPSWGNWLRWPNRSIQYTPEGDISQQVSG